MMAYLLSVLLFYLIVCSRAFSFYFTSLPTQCANMTIEWTGGMDPFSLLLVPVGHLNPETRTILQRDIPSGNSVSFILDYPAESKFVAILNDASGIGAGGTSAITTVAPSSNSSCLSSTQSHPKFFLFLPNEIGQCDSIDISWSSEAEPPVDILGVIPAGESFEITNTSGSSTHAQWTADVRSDTQIMFVAGDKDGLGTGGSSDVMQVIEGDGDECISDTSPSSTSGSTAGGVISTTGVQTSTGLAEGTSTFVVTTDDAGSTVTVGGPASTGPLTTTDNAGLTITLVPAPSITTSDRSGSPVTAGSGTSTQGSGNGASMSGFPGSGGGTVTGSSNDNHHPNYLGIILGIVLGSLSLGIILSGIVVYRRRRRGSSYHNLEKDPGPPARPHPWVTALTRGAHIRGGAASSVDTLPSMYQTEPFLLLSEHEPCHISPKEPAPIQQRRPAYAARASSSLSMQTLFGEGPVTRDVFGGVLAGIHGPDHEGATDDSRQPNRSSRTASYRGIARPTTTDNIPTRVTRDSEDFSPETEEMSANPFTDDFIELPPTYASVRRASRSNDREPWQPVISQLQRSNASRGTRNDTT